MNIKAIVKDPHQAMIERWGSVELCPHPDRILALTTDIKHNKQEIETLRKEMQGISRQFRSASQNTGEAEQLKAASAKLSSEIKTTEEQLKSQEAKLHEVWGEDGDAGGLANGLPRRFTTQPGQQDVADLPAIHIVLADASCDTLWDDYVTSHPNASAYHRYRWRSVIEQSTGHQTLYLLALSVTGNASVNEAGNTRPTLVQMHNHSPRCHGVLPLTHLNSHLFGNYMVSLPYFNYGGVLADSKEIESALLVRAAELCKQAGASHLEVRQTRRINDWQLSTSKVSMLLQLPSNATALDQQLGAKLRSQIKQARQHSLETRIGSADLLDDFYRVFATHMRDLGTPVYAQQFFANILHAFPDAATIVVLYHERQPVAVAFLLGSDDMLEIPWASTLRRANHLNANMLLYRQVLEYAIDKGYRYFDFGRSTADAGTYRFKKQWGAIPVQHYWHYWSDKEQFSPGLNPDNPRFQLAIAVWKKLPVWVTRLLGPSIVKNLP